MCIYIDDQVFPKLVETILEENKPEDLEFPVIFKLCFQHSFNLEKIVEVEYSSNAKLSLVPA